MTCHDTKFRCVTEAGYLHKLAEPPRGGDIRLGDVHTGALRPDKQVPEAVSRIKIDIKILSSPSRETHPGLDLQI